MSRAPVETLGFGTAESRFRFDGVAERNPGPGLRVWETEPGFMVKGLAEQNKGLLCRALVTVLGLGIGLLNQG